MIRVLVTAFGAFPGAPSNPTLAIVAQLERRWRRALALRGVELRTAVLPVIYAGAEARAAALAAAERPDAILHLGLAGRRRGLTLETRARNRLSILHPDATGGRAGKWRVEPDGPETRRARAPIAQMATKMAQRARTAPSIDAGDYLCNQTLYASLSGPTPVVTFLHVPRPANPRAPLRRSAGRPSIADMSEAVVAAVTTLAGAARNGGFACTAARSLTAQPGRDRRAVTVSP